MLIQLEDPKMQIEEVTESQETPQETPQETTTEAPKKEEITVEEAQKRLNDMVEKHQKSLDAYNEVAKVTTEDAKRLDEVTASTLNSNVELGKVRGEMLVSSQKRYEALADTYLCLSNLMNFFADVKNQEVLQLNKQVAELTPAPTSTVL